MNQIISFEGIHGAGKTTQLELLEKVLLGRNLVVERIASKDKPFSELVMRFLEDFGPQAPETLFFLSMANDYGIQKRLRERKGIVLLDRYIHTNIASTYLAGKDLDWIYGCLKPFILPETVFLMDVSPERALERKGGKTNNLEKGRLQEASEHDGFIAYQRRLRNAYLDIASRERDIKIINGEGSVGNIHRRILDYLNI